MTSYRDCPVCQNINGMGVLDCDGHDDDAPSNENYIHYHPGTPHECKPALTVFGDRWVCQYNWCARYLGDAE